MENELSVFNSEKFGSIRTTFKDEEVWFVGKDVAVALGYENHRKALIDHVDLEDKYKGDGVTFRDSIGRVQTPTIINESGLYSLVLSSKLPEAKAFKRWITHEVIPMIRKTGGYVNDDEKFIETYLSGADEQTKGQFRIMLGTMRKLNAKIEEDKPKVLFADALCTADTSILVGELAKLLKQNGVEIGHQRLFAWMREHGYLIKRNGSDYNMPTQYSMELGLFEIKERTINSPDGTVRITKTPKCTAKGQKFFVNKFLKQKQ